MMTQNDLVSYIGFTINGVENFTEHTHSSNKLKTKAHLCMGIQSE